MIVVTGPTASGKSSLALKIARECNGEIICADSRSVYKDFDIVSAKSTVDEQKEVPHHLLDVVIPGEDFSVENFKTLAIKAIEDIFSRGHQPIICGGTWFYITSLLGLVSIAKVPPNEALRAELEKKSSLVLFDMLLELNERRAREIEPNNRERVIRAIEIALGEAKDTHDERLCDKYEIEFIIKDMERKELYTRIDARVDEMVKMGLEAEYERNRAKYGPLPIFSSTIGYGEFEENPSRLVAIEKIKQHTRNFAKRQLTWLNGFERSKPTGLTLCHVRTNMNNSTLE